MSDKPLTGHSYQVHNHRTGGSPSIWQTPMESYTPWLGLPNGCNYHNDKPAPAQSHKPPVIYLINFTSTIKLQKFTILKCQKSKRNYVLCQTPRKKLSKKNSEHSLISTAYKLEKGTLPNQELTAYLRNTTNNVV